MNVEDLNQKANDILVARLTIKNCEEAIEHIMSENPEIQALRAEMEEAKFDRDSIQSALIEDMKTASIKSWKTDEANFARASRTTAQVDPEYKKNIERALKAGGEVENWKLNTTDYLSIKVTK